MSFPFTARIRDQIACFVKLRHTSDKQINHNKKRRYAHETEKIMAEIRGQDGLLP
jgi:hypothetical protein